MPFRFSKLDALFPQAGGEDINRLEIVLIVRSPLTPTLSPKPGGEGRVRGLMRVQTNVRPLITTKV
jgi:hypothetical protein